MKLKLALNTTIITVLIGGCADDFVGSNSPPTTEIETEALTTSSVNPVPIAPATRPRLAEEKHNAVQTSPATAALTFTEDRLARKQATTSLQKMEHDMAYAGATGLSQLRPAAEPVDRENYQHFENNPLKLALEQPVSTFSIDVDTGAYSNLRRMLNQGRLPVKDAVRVEELLNYFDYSYPAPNTLAQPFSVITEVGPNPWNTSTKLLHIGIKGYAVAAADIPAANLVFLIDVSGSMQSADKLELLKKGLGMLSKQMRKQDRVSIVVYAGASGVILEPTPGNETFKITHALEQLTAGGSTNGAAGIRLAYQVAESAFIKDGVNRILLATDGDFNVGTTSFEQLMDLVEEKRKSGIGLSTLGFGSGNYNDHLAEQLANRGNGSYAYIDTLNEANKVLVDQLSSTLLTIAKDVKIQLEFNPAVVAEYRLVGYENRMLKREDFNNDKIDAGEIGAGHSVTALYEITLQGADGQRVDALRYGQALPAAQNKDELAYLKLRYKKPGEDSSRLIESSIKTRDILTAQSDSSEHYRFAAAVAGFGQLLRGGEYLQNFSYDDVLALSRKARGNDANGYRGEFIQLVKLAQTLGSQGNTVSQVDGND